MKINKQLVLATVSVAAIKFLNKKRSAAKFTIIVESQLEGVDEVSERYQAIQRIINQHNPNT